MSSHDPEITISQTGGTVHVTLNRPAALNALTLEMIRILSAALIRWEGDDSVKTVLITGAGHRAFCAGGDIKAAYRLGMDYRKGLTSDRVVALFFAEEYRLNRQLFHFSKPIVALMDGITMGGGFGIAGPCRFRVATENTVFAMPETGIGFFPDVGSVYFLNQSPGHIGTYLGVTGSGIGPADMCHAGLATHYIESAAGKGLVEAVLRGEEPAAALARLQSTPRGGEHVDRSAIERCFAVDSIENIIESLAAEGTAWAREVASVMRGRSPLSLKVALAHLRRGRGESFDQVIARDFVLVQHFLKGRDFYEGVRAAVIDKDRQPRWDPSSLADVSAAVVDAYFQKTPYDLDTLAA